MAPWILPRTLAPEVGDVVVVGELAHRLLAPMAADDEEVIELFQQTAMLYGTDEASAWFNQIEVWLGYSLDPNGEWAPPNRS